MNKVRISTHYLLVLVLLTYWSIFSCGCTHSQNPNVNPKISPSYFEIPKDWTQYVIDNTYILHIPNTLELRHDYDEYTRWMNDELGYISSADVVFQQKDLSTFSSEAKATYARVLTQCYSLAPGETYRRDEYPSLTNEDYDGLNEMVEAESAPGKPIVQPSWEIVDINGSIAIQGIYSRTGLEGPVNCRFYLLSDFDKIVKMIVAYREKDKDMWEEDLSKIIYTFKWNNPQ